jgi:hypothetical protein
MASALNLVLNSLETELRQNSLSMLAQAKEIEKLQMLNQAMSRKYEALCAEADLLRGREAAFLLAVSETGQVRRAAVGTL